MRIYTTAFENNKIIPKKFTCDGENVSPEIFIENVPSQARSLVLIVEDPDSPGGDWSHWVVWNIDPTTKFIKENSIPEGATSGLNDFKNPGYGGPCPFKGEHRYFFKIFAISKILSLSSISQKADVEKEIAGCALEESEFIGRYSRV